MSGTAPRLWLLGSLILLSALLPRAASIYVPIHPRCEQMLHEAANRAIKASDHGTATTLLRAAAEHGGSARSFLLLALHEQQMGRAPGSRLIAPEYVELARTALLSGLKLDPKDAKLLQVPLHDAKRPCSPA